MPGKVISTLDEFRKDTLNREKDSMLIMTRRWKGVEDALTPQIDALSRDIDALRAAGKDIAPDKLYSMDRYKALLAQTRNEATKYEGWAGRHIEQGQKDYFELGNAAARTMLKDLLPPGVNIDFNRLPPGAVNNMIGLCKDGSPLFDVLKKRALFPEAVDGLTTQLINAMALGWNPRKTAEAMANGLAAGLNKALVIARTEQLRAYREATYQNYKANSDIVKGWIWHSALGTRTCAACWSMHGSVHSLDERLDDHVCGRCAMIPQTKSWSELGYTGVPDTNPVVPSGENVFSKLSEEKQRGILGNVRFQMYKDGTLDFSKLSNFTDDPTWGRSLQITPLKELALSIPPAIPVPQSTNVGLLHFPDKTLTNEIIENRIRGLMNPMVRTGYTRLEAEEALNKAVSKLQNIVNKSEFATNAPTSAARQILNDGQFKTQFETGTSKGNLNPGYRVAAEFRGLGIPQTVNPELRPIYGAVEFGANAAPRQYGAVSFVYKDSVRNRTTVTFGDSLGDMLNNNLQGAPVGKINGAAFRNPHEILGFIESDKIPSYIEVQIQGPVTMDDVAKIRIKLSEQGTPHADAVVKKAKELGIPFEWVQ